MLVIIGEFKDTKQIFFINDSNKTDSLKRTLLKENATVFDSTIDIQKYIKKMEKESHRFNECTFSFKDLLNGY